MNNKAKQIIKAHGPTAGIAIVTVAIVAHLTHGTQPAVMRLTADPRRAPADPSTQMHGAGLSTRLVSCGDSREMSLTGDDAIGTARPGPGAGGKCTVLFARPWVTPPTCTATGGIAAKTTVDDLELIQISGRAVSYRCRK